MSGEPLVRWEWIGDHLGLIVDRLGQHVYLAAIAVALGFLISFVLAAISIRRRRLYPWVVLLSSVVYTIPSFAFFEALVAIIGLALTTAEIPLVLYTFVIFVPNIVAGFDSVPWEVLDAADGLGFTPWQRFWRVELPLAVPLVIAGLRLATVSTVGLVTVSAVLGDRFGGLGYFILDGYHRSFPTELLLGGILSIALAVVADIAFVLLQRAITPWARERARGAAMRIDTAPGGEASPA